MHLPEADADARASPVHTEKRQVDTRNSNSLLVSPCLVFSIDEFKIGVVNWSGLRLIQNI